MLFLPPFLLTELSAQLRKLSFTIIHSSTKLLLAWKQLLKLLKLAIKVMPRDVATRWNSTYILLEFASIYREAIDKFTSDRDNEVRNLELSVEEWEIDKELQQVLKVRALSNLDLQSLIV